MSRRGRGGGECDRCCEELVILKRVVEDVEDGEGEAHSWSGMREGGREGGHRRKEEGSTLTQGEDTGTGHIVIDLKRLSELNCETVDEKGIGM
jgi:hypothetical protein